MGDNHPNRETFVTALTDYYLYLLTTTAKRDLDKQFQITQVWSKLPVKDEASAHINAEQVVHFLSYGGDNYKACGVRHVCKMLGIKYSSGYIQRFLAEK